MGLPLLTGLEKGEQIRAPISDMHPGPAWIRGADGLHLAHPDVRFPVLACVPLSTAFSLGSGNAHQGFLREAPQHRSGGRLHRQHRLQEKPSPAFVAD